MLKVVYCKISSWAGRVNGAEHYYTDLSQRVSPRDTKKVWHNLTQSEADRLNRRTIQDPLHPDPTWEAGEEIGHFFDRERAVKGAIAAYKEMFPGAIILVEGDIGTYEPQPILDGPPDVMKAINNLVKRADDNDGWEGDEEVMQAIADEWETIWIPEFEEE